MDRINWDNIERNISLLIARLSSVALLLLGVLCSWAIVRLLSKNASILLVFGLIVSVVVAFLGVLFIKNTFTKKFKR